MRLFGRNKDRPLPDGYEIESERVLKAVSSNICAWPNTPQPATHLDELGAYEAWAPYTSIFQRTAFEGPYGDIVSILARIESRLVFND